MLDALWRAVGDGRELAPAARELLRQYTWPGNAREVDAIVRRLNKAAAAGILGLRRTIVEKIRRLRHDPGRGAGDGLPAPPARAHAAVAGTNGAR